jgi:hypothetical protein
MPCTLLKKTSIMAIYFSKKYKFQMYSYTIIILNSKIIVKLIKKIL